MSVTGQTLATTKARDLEQSQILNVFFKHLDICNTLVKGELITQMQALTLCEFIKSEFKDMSAEDVEDAVKKYLSKKMNCDASYCVKMSAEYLGIILSSYRAYKRDNCEIKPIASLSETTEIEKTDKEHYFSIIKYIEENKQLPDWGSNIYLPAFKYCDAHEIITSNEEKQKFIDEIRLKMAFELKELRTMQSSVSAAKIQIIRNYSQNEFAFKNNCREKYLKKLLKEKYNL